MNSNNKQLIQTLGRKLGVTSPSTLSKAEELQRRLSMRGVKGLTTSAEVVICLQLAATLAREPCDKVLCAKLSGLSGSRHRGQVQALGQLLGVNPQLTIHDLAITHSVLPAEDLGKEVLCEYQKQAYDIDISLPLYQCAALLAACKHLKIKLDKKKIHEISGAQKKVLDLLVEKLTEVLIKITEKKKSSSSDVKSKRAKTLMDIIEDNLSEDASTEQQKRKQEAVATSAKQLKHNQDDEDQEYEAWKRKILLETEQHENCV